MSSQSNYQRVDPTLKTLGFFQVFIRKVTTHLSVLYDDANVKLIVGPIYRKIEGKSFEILLVADRKTHEAARSISTNSTVVRVMEKTKDMTKSLYVKSELIVELVWHKMKQVLKVMYLVIPSLAPTSYYSYDADRVTTYLIEGFLFYLAFHILRFLLSLIPLEKIKNLIYQKLTPLEKIKNLIYQKWESWNTGSEINEVSESQVDNSTEQ